MLALALLLLTSSAQTPQDSGRTPVSTPTPAYEHPIKRAIALYGEHPELASFEGGLLVLDPNGAPVEGATVALVELAVRREAPEVLEVAFSGSDGRVELEQREAVNHIVVWKGDVPAVNMQGSLLRLHRTKAGEGSMVVQLLPPAEVRGHITLDGAPPRADFELWFSFPYMLLDWPAVEGSLREALAALDPPSGIPRVTVEPDGAFRVDGFTWPAPSRGNLLPATLRWKGTDIFRTPPLGSTKPPTRSDLRVRWIRTLGEEIQLDLAHGGWISGKVTAGNLGSLDREMKLHFALPFETADDTRKLTSKPPEEEKVKRDGSFRFCVPMPFGPLDLLLETGLEASDRERAKAQVFHVEPPTNLEGRIWSLGQLLFDFRAARLLLFHDTAGTPLSGVQVLTVRVENKRLPPRPPAVLDESGPTRKLIAMPPPGSRLIASRRGFDPTTVDDLHSKDGALDVTLHRSARLRLTTDLSSALPASRLYAQLEAQEPALGLFASDRTTALQERTRSAGTPVLERLIDARSTAPWSFTASFRYGRSAPPEPGPTRLDLVGITPGVPFHLRVFETTGAIFLERDIPAFTTGEGRELEFTIPAPSSPVRGQVIDAAGAAVPNVEIHFGSVVPAHVATTDADGHFEITGAYQLEGSLLVQSFTSYSLSAYPAGGGSGRLAQTLLFVHGFRFRASGETVIELPASEALDVRLIDAAGKPSFADWQLRLYDETGTEYLTGTYEDAIFRGVRMDATEHVIELSRPAGQTTLLVATYLNSTIEVSVPPGIEKLDLTLPVLGAVRLEGLSRELAERVDLGKFTPKNQAESFYRWWGYFGGTPQIEDILPGTYTLELLGEVDDHTPAGLLYEPIEVTVRPGLTTEVHVNR
jgi:hypothetical protein